MMNISKKYDVVIVGCGIAGLYSALHFDKKTSILIVSKRESTLSNSSLAQGGIAAVLDTSNDSFDLHLQDTLIAGREKNDVDAVKVLVQEGPDDVRKLIDYGVEFDKDLKGNLNKTLEGGHSRRRIVHKKDQTGSEIVNKLLEQVGNRGNITLLEDTTVAHITRVVSGFCVNMIKDNEQYTVFSSYCLLATGGIGRVYSYTTNPAVATGDGIRIAYELGARIKDLSYVQFHPTAYNRPGVREQFLISEAVRGEGAYLLNSNKERFMHRYDERLELAPRDIISRSIILESRRTGNNSFYLDIRHKPADYLINRFPTIAENCNKMGTDITKDLIPVFPCHHYLMGGIQTDINARTTIPRLYAAGECANTGVHGANRLASNSLLEALVFGRRAAQDIQKCIDFGFLEVEPVRYSADYSGAPLPVGLRTEIRRIMQRGYFVIPDIGAVHEGLKRIDGILKRLKTGRFAITRDYCEALSLATVASIILREVDER